MRDLARFIEILGFRTGCLILAFALWQTPVFAKLCSPTESDPVQNLLDQVEGVTDETSDTESLKPASPAIKELRQIFNRHWIEENKLRNVSEQTEKNYRRSLSQLGLEPSENRIDAQLEIAINRILSIYLRWWSAANDQTSSELVDFPVSLDPSLAEFLGLSANDPRSLSEVVFDELLRSDQGKEKLLQLSNILDRFFGSYEARVSQLSLLLGPDLSDQFIDSAMRVPRTQNEFFVSRGQFPKLSMMQGILSEYEIAMSYFDDSLRIYLDVYRARLSELMSQSGLDWKFVLEAFQIDESDIQELRRQKLLAEEIDELEQELQEMRETRSIDLDRRSPFRMKASLEDILNDQIDLLRIQMSPSAFLDSLILEDVTQEGSDGLNEVVINDVVMTGFSKLEKKYLENLEAQVRSQFTQSFDRSTYNAKDFENSKFADPSVFLGGEIRFKNGSWERATTETRSRNKNSPNFWGQTDTVKVWEKISKEDFERLEARAIQEKILEEFQSSTAFSDYNQLSLRKVVKEAKIYGSEGFFLDGEEFSKDRAWTDRWYDPIIERFRDPKNDPIDFEEEVLPKVQLVLSILGEEQISAEYAFLLALKKEDLIKIKTLSSYHSDFALKTDLLKLNQEDFDLSQYSEFIRAAEYWKSLLKKEGLEFLELRFSEADELNQAVKDFLELSRQRKEIMPGVVWPALSCGDLDSIKNSEAIFASTEFSLEDFSEMWSGSADEMDSKNSLPSASFSGFFKQARSCLEAWRQERTRLALELSEDFQQEASRRVKLSEKRFQAMRLALEAIQNNQDWRAFLSEDFSLQGDESEILKGYRADQIKALEALLKRVLARQDDGLNENEKELRQKLVEFLKADLSLVLEIRDRNLSLQDLISENQASMSQLVELSFERASIQELLALKFLSQKNYWDQMLTRSGSLNSQDLFVWLSENFEAGSDQKFGILDFQKMAELIDSSDALAISDSVIPQFWGENWQKHLGSEISPTQMMALGMEDTRAVLDFLVDHQRRIIPYLSGSLGYFSGPLNLAGGVNRAFEVNHEGLDVLQRWNIPTNPEHVSKLLKLGDRIAWKSFVEAYLAQLEKSEESKKRKEFKKSDKFPPAEVTRWLFEKSRITDLDLLLLDDQDSREVASKMKIFEADEDDQIYATHTEKDYLAQLSSFFERAFFEAINSSLMAYDEFLIDFFGSQKKENTKQVLGFFQGEPPSGNRAIEKFLNLLGFELGEIRPPSLLRQTLKKIQKDNSELWSDFQDAATKFFQEAHWVKFGPLSEEDLSQLAYASKDPEVRSYLLGYDASGQLKEGEELSQETAEILLKKLNHEPKDYDLKKVREQMNRLRKFLLSAQELFPVFQASLSQNLIQYLSLELLEKANKDDELIEELLVDDLDRQLDQRLSGFQDIIIDLGMSSNSEANEEFEALFRKFSANLKTAILANDINADLFFESLNAFMQQVVLPRAVPEHPISQLNDESYQELVKSSLASLREVLKSLNSDSSVEQFLNVLSMSPKKSFNAEMLDKFQKAFPVSENQMSLRSIYSEAGESHGVRFDDLVASFDSKISVLLKKGQAKKARMARRAIPFDEVFASTGSVAESLADLDRIVPSLEKSFDFLNEKNPEFFMRSQRESSVSDLLTFLLGEEDYQFLFSRLKPQDRFLVNQSVRLLLDQWNKTQIKNWGNSNEKIYSEIFEEFFKVAIKNHFEAVKEVNQSLKELEGFDNPALIESLNDSIRQKMNESFGREAFESFLSKMEVPRSQREALLSDSNLEFDLQSLQNLNSNLNNVFSALTMAATRVDGEAYRREAVAAILPKMKEALELPSTINRSNIPNQKPINFDLLLEGTKNRIKEDLEEQYDRVKMMRAERARMDSSFVGSLVKDIGYMFWDGVKGIGAETYRLVLENLLVNSVAAFGGYSSGSDVARSLAESLGLENVSNFSKERILRGSDDVLSEVLADGMGLFITAISFGGLKAASLGLQGGSKAIQSVSRPGFNLAGAQSRLAASRFGSFMTRERYFGGFRGPASQRAVAAGIQTQAARFAANPVARASAETALARTGRALSDQATRWSPLLGAIARNTAPRLLIDSALIAGVALGGQYLAYGSLENLGEGFSEHFAHGIGFMGALSLIHLSLHKWPMPNRLLSTILIHYIVKDASRNVTQSLMVESESFRDLLNVAFADSNLELESREYDRLPEGYWKRVGALSKAIPDEEKWVQLPNGEELLAQWAEDQSRIMAAISGSFIVGLIAGSPLVGRALDRVTYQKLMASQGKPSAQSKVLETLAQAYGGNSQRYYDWAKRDRLKTLRAEEMKKPEKERRSEQELEVSAEQFVKENFPRVYEEVHPELMIERLARLWTMQGRPMERLRAEAEASVRFHYERIYNEMNAGAMMNPLLRAHMKNNRVLTVEEAVKKFNQAWDSGVKQGQALRTAEFERLDGNPGKISEYFDAFQALGERLDSFLRVEGKSEASAKDLHKILLEFNIDSNTPLGQMLIREIVLPRLQAIESGRVIDPLFHSWDFRSPDANGRPRLKASDFAKLIREQVQDPLAWAEIKVVNEDVLSRFRKDEGGPRTEITTFRTSDSETSFNVYIYRQDGKRYLEAFNLKIELPDTIEVRMRNNGDLHLIDKNRNQSLEVSSSTATDQFGSWGLSAKPAPRISEQLINWVRESEAGVGVPRMAKYDVTRVDPTTGKRSTKSEDVFILELTKELQMISLPDGSFLLSYLGEKPVKPSFWKRVISRKARQEAREIDFVSDVHLPKGWELVRVENDVFVFRDRFQFEIEIHFRDQKIEVFHPQTNSVRAKVSSFYAENGKPMGLREFVDQLSYFPGVLPTEVAMASYLADSGAALKRDLRFMENTRARIDDRIVIEQGEVLGFKSQELNSSNRQRIAESQIKIQRSAESKRNEIFKSDAEALRASEKLKQIEIPENMNPIDLVQASTQSLFVQFLDDVSFAHLKGRYNFKRSSSLDRTIKEHNPSQADILNSEKIEFINSRTPQELADIFSRSDIELVWRVSRQLERISEARRDIFEVLHRRDLEMAWREVQFLQFNNNRLPENLSQLNDSYQSKLEFLILQTFDGHSVKIIDLMGRNKIIDAVYSKLSIKEKNFLGTDLVSRERLEEINFKLPEDRLLPGLSDDVLKAFISDNLPRLLQEDMIATKLKDHVFENLDLAVQSLRNSKMREFETFQKELKSLEESRILLESWLTSQP